MFKKIFATALTMLLLVASTAFAANMQVTSSAVPVSGGTITPNGIKFYSAAATYTVVPKTGWSLKNVEIDGVVSTAPYTVPFDTSKVHTVKANFVQDLYSITTTAGSGGSIQITGGGSYNITPGSTRSYVVSPGTGNQIASLTVNGTPVTIANATVAYTGSLTNITANQTIAATFSVIPVQTVVNAGDDQTVAAMTTNLNGSVSDATPVTWTYTGPAGASFGNANAKATTFTATVLGTYTVRLTAGSVFDEAIITVGATGTTCTTCHAGSAPVTSYSQSVHALEGVVTCSNCHMPKGEVHPGTTPTNATCAGCHGSVTGHNTAASACSNCHDSHAASSTHPTAVSRPDCATCHETVAVPHYGGTAFIEAQYVSDASLPVSCSNCHGDLVNTTANQAILAQFTSSAHGSPLTEAWRHYDWRSSSRASCQRCHAGTAFVAKLGNENSTTNAYQPTDILKPGEVLNCSACHTDAGTGALRTAAQQFTINMTNAATATYDVVGASTLCARCHSGRETGDSIKADPDADGVRGFIDSHYLGAAGTVYNKGGYEYAGQDYDTLGYHKNVGTGVSGTGSQGPCVACHMGLGTANHTWNVANSNACGNCHSNPTAAKLAQAKASYEAALDSLRLALEAKGIYYDANHPYFFTAPYDPNKAVYDPTDPTATNTPFTNWAGVYGVSSWKDVMGAAFNYNLLVNDPGAYAHNKQYALKLIADSCDFLADSAVDGQGIPAAVTTAINSVAFGLR